MKGLNKNEILMFCTLGLIFQSREIDETDKSLIAERSLNWEAKETKDGVRYYKIK